MRTNRKAILAAAVMATALASTGRRSTALADDFAWTSGDATNPTVWNTAATNWHNDSTNTANVPWTNNANRATPNNAFFGNPATPITIQVNDNIDAGIISFLTAGWVLDPATTGGVSSGAAPTLTLSSGADSTIGAAIVDGSSYGAVGGVTAINVIGGGTIRLTATNTYTGGSTISNGELRISDLSNIGSGSITFNGGNAFLG